MKKQSGTTNILLGIIAAEVVFLAAQAIARRNGQTTMGNSSGFSPRGAEEEATPQRGFLRYLLGEAAHHAGNLLHRLASSAGRDIREGAQRVRDRVASFRPERDHGEAPRNDGASPGNQSNGDHWQGLKLKGDTRGIASKLEDPAWAGVLAASDGDATLASAKRAVPMPDSEEFVERLDKNPHVGKGIKDRSRNEHMSHRFPPQVLKIPGVTGDR